MMLISTALNLAIEALSDKRRKYYQSKQMFLSGSFPAQERRSREYDRMTEAIDILEKLRTDWLNSVMPMKTKQGDEV